MSTKKTVSLVLGSGGARGLAHIGIINWLEENNYKIDPEKQKQNQKTNPKKT